MLSRCPKVVRCFYSIICSILTRCKWPLLRISDIRTTSPYSIPAPYAATKKISFVMASKANKILQTSEDQHNYFQFLQELAEGLHDGGYQLGQSIDIGIRNKLITNFNETEVSKLVDWFYFAPFRANFDHFMESTTPLTHTHHGKSQGTTTYWLEKVLQLIKPGCLVVDLGPRLETHRAIETAVQPGPGSSSKLLRTGDYHISRRRMAAGRMLQMTLADFGNYAMIKPLAMHDQMHEGTLSVVCLRLHNPGDTCQEFWDEESSSPWTVCRNDYYTYDNERSLRLKVDLVKQYNITGVMLWDDDITADNICNNGDPLAAYKAVQGIRQKRAFAA